MVSLLIIPTSSYCKEVSRFFIGRFRCLFEGMGQIKVKYIFTV